jgi:chorismate mutase/prephenate dehydratase
MDLDALREQIDHIDREIVDRLNQRVRLASEIGHIKMAEGKAVYVPSREEEVFGKLTAHSDGPLPETALRAIWREVISAAIALERPVKIAYLGPEATYTHQAAMKNFGHSLHYMDLTTVPDVFDCVKRGESDYGVVPVENSTQGTVISTLDMLVEAGLTIVAQIYLEISHALISNSPLEEITAVHSKDNALGQCRAWLARRLPGVELVDATSTAAAVELARDNPGVAAIASKVAAQLYDVPIVEENIQDKQDNITRFLVIGKEPTPRLGKGRDKSTFVFTLPNNHPGALIKALFPFSMRGINISKIESRPSRKKLWDYYFYIDVTGHREDPELTEAIAELEQFCPFLKWLGSYPNTTL